MKCSIITGLAFLTMAPLQVLSNSTAMENLLTTVNFYDRMYEKNVLGIDKTFWNLAKNAAAEYDFIVVGCGSSGSVIANRLSEISKWKVLALEAGIPEDSLINIPTLGPALQGSVYDYGYKSEKLNHSGYCIHERKMPVPRGKCLGGSSAINYMMYVRGNKHDYDNWAALGNPGWSYDEVLPYFMKSENASNLHHMDPRYHGMNGYQNTENSYESILTRTFLKAGEEVGLPTIDYNAPTESFGLSVAQGTLLRGRRETSARAFLHPIADRENLDILTKAFVTKILIRKESKEAYGVIYEKEGKSYKVLARKEVIISAGAINSPQLLMLSGIGPKQHLKDHGIDCLQDLAVGKNLQDHLVSYNLVYNIKFDIDQTQVRILSSIPEYILYGTGPLRTLTAVEGIGFIKTPVSKVKEDQPDIELLLARGSLAGNRGNFVIDTGYNMVEECYNSVFVPLESGYQWTIAPILLHPKSVGEVLLKSTNPYDPPLIYASYLSDPDNQDLKTMIAAVRFIQRLGNTTAFKEQDAQLSSLKLYGCEHFTFDTDEYWECVMRSISYTMYHVSGTAKMGPPSDPTAVVDSRLQVYGIKNLRVADCSIFPNLISGHPHAPALMIGEKVSDFIKEQWGETKV